MIHLGLLISKIVLTAHDSDVIHFYNSHVSFTRSSLVERESEFAIV